MKYSLRSLMIAVLVLPPLLGWGGMPIYRWLTTPKPRNSLSIKNTREGGAHGWHAVQCWTLLS